MSVEEFEKEILEAPKKIEEECEKYGEKEFQRITERAGEIVGHPIAEDEEIPRDVWLEAYDTEKGMENSLVKPSMRLNKFGFDAGTPTRGWMDKLLNAAQARASEVQELNPFNTEKAYEGDILYWEAYLSAIGFNFKEPLKEKHIKAFIIHHLDAFPEKVDQLLVENNYKQFYGTHRKSTVERRLASLSVYLNRYKLPNPCKSPEIKKLLKKYSQKRRPKSEAITLDVLLNLLAASNGNLIDVRDRAILTFAWCSGGRRRSEIVNARAEDLKLQPEGDYTYFMPESKSDQEKEGCHLPIRGIAARFLKVWLDASEVKEGFIFRPINKSGQVKDGKLPDITVTRIVKKRAKLAGYDPERYSAHGLRSGFVTEAGKRNIPLAETMELSRHKSEVIASRYYQPGKALNNLASTLAG